MDADEPLVRRTLDIVAQQAGEGTVAHPHDPKPALLRQFDRLVHADHRGHVAIDVAAVDLRGLVGFLHDADWPEACRGQEALCDCGQAGQPGEGMPGLRGVHEMFGHHPGVFGRHAAPHEVTLGQRHGFGGFHFHGVAPVKGRAATWQSTLRR